jgi:hypothetical protein
LENDRPEITDTGQPDGKVENFGLADFNQLTLVLRYRGEVCYNNTDKK